MANHPKMGRKPINSFDFNSLDCSNFWLFCALLFVSFSLFSKLSDPDLWWHLSIGKWIVNHHAVPTIDIWNAKSSDSLWLAYSWLPEVSFSLVDQFFGLTGIYIYQNLLAIFFVIFTYYIIRKISSSNFAALFLTTTLAVGCYSFFSLRPQVFSWMLLLFLLFVLETKHNRSVFKNYLFIFLIFLLWANSHLSTCIGILTISIWIFPNHKNEIRFYLWAIATAFFASLFTPYFGKEWFILINKFSHPISERYISEFQNASLSHFSTGASLALFLYLSICLLKRKVEIKKYLLVSCFYTASLLCIKFLPYSLIYLVFLAAKNLKFFSKKIKFTFACLSIFTCLMLIRTKKFDGVIEQDSVPVNAINYIIENDLPFPILHSFNTGGYIIYRFLNPDGTTSHPAIIDGRTNVNDPNITSAFLESWTGSKKWKDYIKITKPGTILWEKDNSLSELLLKDDDWKQVYPSTEKQDLDWLIFVKRE